MHHPALCVRVFLDWPGPGADQSGGRLRPTGSGHPAGVSCHQRRRPVVRYSERMRFARLLLT